jgi:hypothetical protein
MVLGGQCYEKMSVVYEFSYLTTMFVRLGWRNLKGTNTLAHYKTRKLWTKKVV